MKKNYWFALVIAAFLCPMVSCKKTDKLAEQVNNLPFLITTDVGLVPWHLPNYSYQRSYLVGDTAALLGKFFLDKPGFQVMVGNSAAAIVFKTQIPSNVDSISSLNEYTHQENKLDYIRFVITQSMGTGNRIPVTITANGVAIQAPTISIQQFQGALGRTDTTLYVDSLTSWQPADYAFYQQNMGSGLPLIANQSVSRDGTVCFSNLTGIYALQNGTVNRWIGCGDQFQENGVFFSINKVMGSVIALAGDSLAFSAEVSENTPDTATNFIFRLCKMDLASRNVRTINRTEWQKGTASVNAPLGPAQGPATGISLIATNLKTDLSGSIYFFNFFAPPRTDFDVTALYAGGIGLVAVNFFYQQFIGNICRVDVNGQVKSLVTQNSPGSASYYTVPGYPSQYNSDYLVSQDGKAAFIVDKINLFDYVTDYTLLNLDQLNPILSMPGSPPYRYHSYDTSSITGSSQYHAIIWNLTNLATIDMLLLPDGELLAFQQYSIAAFNPQNETDYCFAGTEAALNNAPPPTQINTTGPAKYILFNGYGYQSIFAGLDKSGAIYYYNLNTQDYGGVTFYKMYPKK